MVFKNLTVNITVTATNQIDGTAMSVHFKRPAGFDYESGDWMDIRFHNKNPNGGVTYSFSSSPTETDLAITFKRGVSPFKRKLQSVKPGDLLTITQYGNDYKFHLNENRSSVLIAGGIGIAPFRSMLKQMYDSKSSSSVQLLYLSKKGEFYFIDEIRQWLPHLPNTFITCIDTQELNRKNRNKSLLAAIQMDAHHYFIAGPEGMVESTEHLLLDHGVAARDIRIDSFRGY